MHNHLSRFSRSGRARGPEEIVLLNPTVADDSQQRVVQGWRLRRYNSSAGASSILSSYGRDRA